jgi:hypothetical protein
LQNLANLKKASREKRDQVDTTIGSTSINNEGYREKLEFDGTSQNTQNEAMMSKSVDSSKNDCDVMQTFETERTNKPNVAFNQFNTFHVPNPTYKNNIERYW